MSLGANIYQFLLGLGCVSGEVIFGLRKGGEIPTLSCIWLVHIGKNRVGIILNKWSWCEIWIHIRIERIVIVEFHFTNNHKKNENANKQIKRKKKSKLSLY